ncbi:MAG: hypothetical protein PUC30_12250 [Lachnospiraceae bacterium]|nr:hypothetical protein [Lachnospiraceae bacterium]
MLLENLENENPVSNVTVYNVILDTEQFTELTTGMRHINDKLETVNTSIGHATTFLILLVLFQFYGLLSRARKKGGA